MASESPATSASMDCKLVAVPLGGCRRPQCCDTINGGMSGLFRGNTRDAAHPKMCLVGGVKEGSVYDENRESNRDDAKGRRGQRPSLRARPALPCESSQAGATRGERGRRRECLALLHHERPGILDEGSCVVLFAGPPMLSPNRNRRSRILNPSSLQRPANQRPEMGKDSQPVPLAGCQ